MFGGARDLRRLESGELHSDQGSCLRCDFEEPNVDALNLEVRSTGLRPERIGDPSATVEEEDIQNAPAERKDWLRSKRGKLVCSIVSEAVLAALSAENQHRGFEPSVPFVACLSACMVVTELVRHCAGWTPVLETGYQFDSLVGPQNGMFKAHERKVDCECVSRRKNIELVRARRKNSTGFCVQE